MKRKKRMTKEVRKERKIMWEEQYRLRRTGVFVPWIKGQRKYIAPENNTQRVCLNCGKKVIGVCTLCGLEKECLNPQCKTIFTFKPKYAKKKYCSRTCFRHIDNKKRKKEADVPSYDDLNINYDKTIIETSKKRFPLYRCKCGKLFELGFDPIKRGGKLDNIMCLECKKSVDKN